MRETQREQVRDNAKYLRAVRPIDPEEIHEYVEGRPHPAAVRQVLRESATDLGLLERADETFVPVAEGPIEASVDGVEAFPERYAHVLEDALVERFGPGWPEGDSGDRLRARIREIKERYLEGRDVTYDDLTALGYALYHLPGTYAATQHVLGDLAADGEIPADLRVLDVGAGVGGPALGLNDLLPDEALVEYHAVEPSAAADLLERLLAETGRNRHHTVHRTTAEAFDPAGEYDLLLFANVLSELDAPAAVVARYLEHLAAEGSIVAVAPADRNTATGLREVERTLEREAGATVYAPAARLWPGETPQGECWSFDVAPDLAVPPFQRRLDEGAREESTAHERREGTPGPAAARAPGDGEFVNVDVQYAFGIWRRDDTRRVGYRPDPDRTAKMADTEEFVTERVNLAGIKLSHDLSGGENPLYLLGDGSERVDHFAVLTRETGLNRELGTAGYGDPLRFENALVLWNDDEGAYNLVVDGETVVDRVPE
ncbi:MAG: small ribosomal subunit Rsm22 family protein [Haloarculaceae archaeon]